MAICLPHRKNPDDVRVADGRRNHRLAFELLHALFIVRVVLIQDFNRHLTVQSHVTRLENHAHSPNCMASNQ